MIDRRNLLLTSLSAIALAPLAACVSAPIQTDMPQDENFSREDDNLPELLMVSACDQRIVCQGFDGSGTPVIFTRHADKWVAHYEHPSWKYFRVIDVAKDGSPIYLIESLAPGKAFEGVDRTSE